ncbi:hypothetical protein GQ42DRAFT_159941 [Ramicandelaber brevisporus]|nr:hypothetical protein GQ42DRAFT_159941 [Ramicandelaber brevisporus]
MVSMVRPRRTILATSALAVALAVVSFISSPVAADAGQLAACFAHPDPIEPRPAFRTATPCNQLSKHSRALRKSRALKVGRADASDTIRPMPAGNHFINVALNCYDTREKCEKVRTAANRVVGYMAMTVNFVKPIKVSLNYYSFCKRLGQCSNGRYVLGRAGPAATFLLEGDDGRLRTYPQALVRQFTAGNDTKTNRAKGKDTYGKKTFLKGADGVTFTDYDIIGTFNSDAPWWFKDDPPIKSGLYDLEHVMNHEFTHGLGISTSWRDPFGLDTPIGLTPELLLDTKDVTSNMSTGAPPGFYESAFDRYLFDIKSGKSLSNYADTLNSNFDVPELAKAFSGISNMKKANSSFDDTSAIRTLQLQAADKFNQSTAAIQAASYILERSQGNPRNLAYIPPSDMFNTLLVDPKGSDPDSSKIFIETGLNPYSPGSSLSHISIRAYESTYDFLMVWSYNGGISLTEEMKYRGQDLPYGPRLQAILRSMGYELFEVRLAYDKESGSTNSAMSRGVSSSTAALAAVAVAAYTLLF